MNRLEDHSFVVMLGMLGFALTLIWATPVPAATGQNPQPRAERAGRSAARLGPAHGNGGGVGTPELDPGAMAGALTLLAGGAAIAIERRRGIDLPAHEELRPDDSQSG